MFHPTCWQRNLSFMGIILLRRGFYYPVPSFTRTAFFTAHVCFNLGVSFPGVDPRLAKHCLARMLPRTDFARTLRRVVFLLPVGHGGTRKRSMKTTVNLGTIDIYWHDINLVSLLCVTLAGSLSLTKKSYNDMKIYEIMCTQFIHTGCNYKSTFHSIVNTWKKPWTFQNM